MNNPLSPFTGSWTLKKLHAWLVCCLFIACISTANAQTDTAKVPIEVLPGTGLLQFFQTDTGAINKLIGNVALKQGENLMFSDSAYFNLEKNSVEAFGNVRIVQPGSTGESDYMRYEGNIKQAYMRGNVMLTDGKGTLWSEEVTYNMGTKIGTFHQGGTLQNDATVLTSNSGIYNMQNKDARFMGDVIVTDPEYHITSEDLGYNTDTKVVTFFSPSVVTSDSSILKTSSGTYDTKNEIAHFTSRSSILNVEQYIEADLIDFNKQTGIGAAEGNVIAIDTAQHTTLYSGRADYNQRKKIMLATIKPVLKQMSGNDSLFIRADTLYSAPVPRPIDTMTIEVVTGKGKDKKVTRMPAADIAIAADSNRPRYFIGYHNVLIFSDSLQGRCDSISYSQEDSIMRMMINPIAWSRNSQITGDTILLYTDSGTIKKMFVPNNAFMISQSGPPKANLFDQVQGQTITGFFTNNTITHMIVQPQAETIYYAKDENEAYLGVNEATSERMRVFFENQQIDRIIFEQDVKQKMTPLDKADLPNMKLSRYQWHIDKRPKSLAELFE